MGAGKISHEKRKQNRAGVAENQKNMENKAGILFHETIITYFAELVTSSQKTAQAHFRAPPHQNIYLGIMVEYRKTGEKNE